MPSGNLGGDGTDNYDFSALPGGLRNTSGTFNFVGTYGNWWSASESTAANSFRRHVCSSRAGIERARYAKAFGFSLRCVQD